MPSRSQITRAKMMLLVGGYDRATIKAATDVRDSRLHELACLIGAIQGDLPLQLVKNVIDGAQVHRMAHKGEFGPLGTAEGQYTVSRSGLQKYCRKRLADGAETLARYMLFCGKPRDVVEAATGIGASRVAAIANLLKKNGCNDDTDGPYSATQASYVLNTIDRRVRSFCEAGRLGQKVGGRYLITRKDLLRFGSLSRRAPFLAEDDAAPRRKKGAA